MCERCILHLWDYLMVSCDIKRDSPWGLLRKKGEKTLCNSQLPHSYYFTTHILVLKFANKGVILRKSRIRIFLEEGGILVLTSMNLEKKGLILISSVLLWKWGFIWAEKSVFYHEKGGSFWTEKSVFYREKGAVWAEKSVFCRKKGGNFQTGEQGWVPLFQVSEGAGVQLWWSRWYCHLVQICVALSLGVEYPQIVLSIVKILINT